MGMGSFSGTMEYSESECAIFLVWLNLNRVHTSDVSFNKRSYLKMLLFYTDWNDILISVNENNILVDQKVQIYTKYSNILYIVNKNLWFFF